MGRFIDEVGHRYGRLTVIERAANKGGYVMWLCRCDCGKELSIRSSNLRSGRTKSCGCLQKEKAGELSRLPIGEAAFNKLIRSLKHGAKKRNYIWDLTDEQVRQLTSQPCYYCGASPSPRANSAQFNGAYLCNGLDRIDNECGYTIDNVVPCCSTCNKAKNTTPQNEFLSWIQRVYIHRIEIK